MLWRNLSDAVPYRRAEALESIGRPVLGGETWPTGDGNASIESDVRGSGTGSSQPFGPPTRCTYSSLLPIVRTLTDLSSPFQHLSFCPARHSQIIHRIPKFSAKSWAHIMQSVAGNPSPCGMMKCAMLVKVLGEIETLPGEGCILESITTKSTPIRVNPRIAPRFHPNGRREIDFESLETRNSRTRRKDDRCQIHYRS